MMDTPAIMGLVIVRRNVRIEPLTRAEAIRALADLAADMASTQAAKAQGGLDWVRDDRQVRRERAVPRKQAEMGVMSGYNRHLV
jgi:hypothetical protein